VARAEPAFWASSTGGGIRNVRKAIGKMRVLRVWGLKMMRVRPAMKMGREAMWYSRGWNV